MTYPARRNLNALFLVALANAALVFPLAAQDEIVEIDPVPYPEGVEYSNPPDPSDAEMARIAAGLARIQAEVPTLDYEAARFHPRSPRRNR